MEFPLTKCSAGLRGVSAILMQPERSSSYKWILVAAGSFVTSLNEIDRHAIYALFPLLEKDLDTSKLALSMLGSSFLCAYVALGQQAGWVGDRFLRRYVIALSLVRWRM